VCGQHNTIRSRLAVSDLLQLTLSTTHEQNMCTHDIVVSAAPSAVLGCKQAVDSADAGCRYERVDVFESGYGQNYRDFDLAVVTLQEPVGLRAGWLGAKALPPPEVCSSASSTLPSLLAVGYPVEPAHSSFQYSDTCDLQVRCIWRRPRHIVLLSSVSAPIPCVTSTFCNVAR
jgi:hypothetical protein